MRFRRIRFEPLAVQIRLNLMSRFRYTRMGGHGICAGRLGWGDGRKVGRMWKPEGDLINQEALGLLKPVEVLYEFECEFLTFVALDPNDEPLLVHNLCVFERTSRYLVSAIDPRILHDLKTGRIDILTALRQPRCWIADVAEDAEVKSLWRIDFDAVPADHLPSPGAMLTPERA